MSAPWADALGPYAGGKRAAVGGLADEELGRLLRDYKRLVAKRYRVLDPEQIERLLTTGNFYVSTKLDGELWFLVKRGDELALVAYNGRVLLDTPLLRAIAPRLAAAPSDLILAGELTARPHGDTGRSRVHHVATALGEDSLEATLTFHAFDLVRDAGVDTQLLDYAHRLARIRELLGEDEGARARVAETRSVDAAEVPRLYREWVVSDRFEGIVVRNEGGITYKIKSTLTIDAVVLAFGERITGEVRQVRELSVALLADDGSYQLLGAVGTGLSEQDRAAWHAKLAPRVVASRFRLANREGTLSTFVRPEIIIEVRCSDLLAADSWDAPIRRMSLTYSDERGWEPIAETPTAVMIHPIFLRERTDKQLTPADVGMTQITSYVPLPSGLEARAPIATRPAEVVRRAVYTKETKGKIAVRKIVIIDTHKGDDRNFDRNFPSFVIYATDYSVGRKEPLETALRSAATRESADAYAAVWLSENLKKGWVEVESARVGEALVPAG